MHAATIRAFSDELTKIASGGKWGHAAEVAGLGILAAPHAYNAVTGKKASHKTERNTELAGLGVLAAPSVKALLSKHGMAPLSTIGVPQTFLRGRAGVLTQGIEKAMKPAVPKPKFTAADLKSAYAKMGGRPRTNI